MPHISINFSVGTTVYWHDEDQDAMLRGEVVEIQATSENASRYGGDFNITYVVKAKSGLFKHSESRLSDSPRFPIELLEPPSVLPHDSATSPQQPAAEATEDPF